MKHNLAEFSSQSPTLSASVCGGPYIIYSIKWSHRVKKNRQDKKSVAPYKLALRWLISLRAESQPLGRSFPFPKCQESNSWESFKCLFSCHMYSVSDSLLPQWESMRPSSQRHGKVVGYCSCVLLFYMFFIVFCLNHCNIRYKPHWFYIFMEYDWYIFRNSWNVSIFSQILCPLDPRNPFKPWTRIFSILCLLAIF